MPHRPTQHKLNAPAPEYSLPLDRPHIKPEERNKEMSNATLKRSILKSVVSVIMVAGAAGTSGFLTSGAGSAATTAPAAAVGRQAGSLPAVTCGGPKFLPNEGVTTVVADGWSSPNSPYTLYIKDASKVSITGYCIESNGGNYPEDFEFIQYGTSRCLTVDQTDRTITEGACGSLAARFHAIGVTAQFGEIQSRDNKACLEGRGLNNTVTFDPCNPNNNNMLWSSYRS